MLFLLVFINENVYRFERLHKNNLYKKYFKVFDIIVRIKCLKWKLKEGNTIHGVQTPKIGIQEM